MKTDVYKRYNLYITPDLFCVEPRGRDGTTTGDLYLRIDRITNEVDLYHASQKPIPVAQAEVRPIYGLWGIIPLLAGNYLVVISKATVIGYINNCEIYQIDQTDVLPYQLGVLHLTPQQRRYNQTYLDMLKSIICQKGFYYSYDYDLSRTMQWLSEHTSPDFRNQCLYERAAVWYLWNNYLISPLSRRADLQRFCLPIIHGFVGIQQCYIQGHSFRIILISRRPIERPGVRFIVRGVDQNGAAANFVETEQIIEFDQGTAESRRWTAFVQLRGSIPLFWSQKPNLKWQPQPYMRPQDDQMVAFVKHLKELKRRYGGTHVLVNLVNQKGREHRVGGELARVSLQASLDFVRYIPFDFHNECKNLNWSRLSVLRDTLLPFLQEFDFFSSSVANPSQTRIQSGYFRSNCMDCLDRTNVAQAMIAKESLRMQLQYLGIIGEQVRDLEAYQDFMFIFRNLWADNGDEVSRQYAGTGALKTDYTRLGKRTTNGAIQDGINAVTRYYKNNFTDGYKLDGMNILLGYFKLPDGGTPECLDQPLINFDVNGFAIVGAIFSLSMTLLCVLVSENVTATVFWFVIFFAFSSFIYLNGEEFVRRPKLHSD